MAEDFRKGETVDGDFLEEVRENYESALEAFKPSMEEGDKDIDFILNDGWPEAEKALRRKAGSERPMISCDQLNQYTNLVINEVRQHPRQIKISPDGYGATAQLAEIRENRLRSIQYKSDAQAAYLTAMENACQRSYAYARVTLVYVSETSVEQEIRIQRIPNPNSVLFDPACREIDCSDAEFCFVVENFTKAAFKRRWPNAKVIDFDGQMSNDYPLWIKDKYVQVAEYWRVHKTKDVLFVMQGEDGQQRTELESKLTARGGRVESNHVIYPATEDNPELRVPIVTHRDTKTSKIMQYITNGVDKLESNEWIGKWIPIVPLFGKEVYRSSSGRSSKVLMSLIRNAREPQQAFNYFMTCALEAVGIVPRTTYLALEGTLDGYEKDWQEAHHIPKDHLTYKSAQQPDGTWIAIPPSREPFDPPLQNLMIGVESFLRAIQSSVGMYNTSVGNNDVNVKSGTAIKQLDAQSDQGAFHFIDNYNHRFLGAIGRICNDLISKVDAGPRQVTIRTKDNKDKLIWVNKPYTDEQGVEQHHDMSVGEYSVTIGVEPTADSQREAASDFLETFVETFLPLLESEPAKRDALMALGIEIKQLGPIAEQMVKILNPQNGDPTQLQGQMQQLQSQLQQLQVENAALLQDKAAREMEQRTKIELERMKQEGAGSKDAADHANQQKLAELQVWAKIIVAEMQKQSRSTDQIAEQDAEHIENALGAAHEAGTQAVEHAHEHAIADKQAQVAAAQQATAAATQQQSQASDQQHQQTMAEQSQQSTSDSENQ